MASLLVIGGTGFFGKSILDSYRRGLLNKWDINSINILARNASSLSYQYPELIDNSISLIESDISICNEVPFSDYVIHAAASTNAKNYLTRPEIEKRNIQSGTFNYCYLAKKFHPSSRILYCSSGAIYGQQPPNLAYIPEDFNTANVEGLSESKRSYAAAKRDAEEAVRSLGNAGIAVSIARCFSFVGKYLPRDQHFAIGNFIQDGLMGRPITVMADFPVYRSYMYADDLIHWLMTICHNATSDCPTYNVGSDQAVTITQLADMIGAQFNCKVIKPKQTNTCIDRYVPSIAKAFEDLDLKLSTDLCLSINNTIDLLRIKNTHV